MAFVYEPSHGSLKHLNEFDVVSDFGGHSGHCIEFCVRIISKRQGGAHVIEMIVGVDDMFDLA